MLYLHELQFDNLNNTLMTKKTDLSDDEKAIFREAMRDITPLTKKSKNIKKNHQPNIKLTVKHQKTNEDEIYYQLSNYYANSVQAETILSYTKDNSFKKRLNEIKNGKIKYEARLDLHGLQPDAAENALLNFITQQYSLNKRLLLIIHGKGSRHGEDPILKNLVNTWLPQLSQVLLFHSALPKDGGAGAVYILLKKNRD